MLKISLIATLLMVGSLWCVPSAASTGHADVGCGSQSFVDHGVSDQLQLQCLHSLRDSGGLQKLDTKTLDREANYRYTQAALKGKPSDAEAFAILENEVDRRFPPTGERSHAVFAAYLFAGQPAKAEAERQQMALNLPPIDLSSFKNIEKRPGLASYWDFESNGRLMRQGFIALETGPHVVVYSTAGCGVCNAFMRYLETDQRMMSAFLAASVWIDTPDANFSADYYRQWNTRYPFEMHVIFDRENWPERHIAGTPVFLFMKDGRVDKEIQGWSPKRNDEIRQALKQIGLEG
jgi:hypothetical protein